MNKAILFDFDGVLANTFEFCYEINKMSDESLTHEEYRERFMGNINEYRSDKKPVNPKPDFDFFAVYTPKVLATEMDPRIKDVVLNLSQKFLLFIVSSTNTNPIRAFLKQNNLENCFREIYGNDVHASKVEKIGILLKQYTLDPKDCLFITDTVGDIREARKCNVDSVAVTWGYHSREMLEREKPVAVVDRSEELGDFISKRFS